MWFWWFVILPLAAVASGLVFAVEQSHRAGHRYAPRHLTVPDNPGQRPDNQTIPARAFYGSMTLPPGLHHELDWREQTMAELSPAALDPGPGALSSFTPGPDQAPDARSDGAVASSIPALTLGGRAFDPPGHQADTLGPRALAVLDRYERRRQERWALA